MEDLDLRRLRAAENQSLFRAANERIEELNHTFDTFAPYGSWACECAQTDCVQRIEMTLAEYEQLRADPTHFAVCPNGAHVFIDVERVTEMNDRYWTVEKIGIGAKRAAELTDR